MNPFPVECLCSTHASYTSSAGPLDLPAIEICLASFVFEGELTSTSIRLDHIPLPVQALDSLAGCVFSFPVNPEPGYIDGSIYMGSRHHPVDVTRLEFGLVVEGRLALKVAGTVTIESSTGRYAPTSFDLTVSLDLPLDEARMSAMVDAAIVATQACHPKHLGRVMAHLSKIAACGGQMEALRHIVNLRLGD